MTKQLCVSMAVNCFIDADKALMYHVLTGEEKPYSEIDPSDENWILHDCVQIMRDCDEIDPDHIDIEEQ